MSTQKTGVEQMLVNVRDTPLKRELIDCINDLPDEILIAIKPLILMLIENTTTIEAATPETLTADELAAIAKAHDEYERGEAVQMQDIVFDE